MVEIIFAILILAVLRAFFLMLCCPNYKTLKSIVSLRKKKAMDEEGYERIHCKACNYTFGRNPIHSSVGDYSFENGTVMWLSCNFATNIRRK